MPDTAAWPFDDAKNTIAFTVGDVLSGKKPVLAVHHDVSDGGWQFLTGEAIDMAEAMLVGLAEVVGLDPTLLELYDLPLGWFAERRGPGTPWVRKSSFATDWDDLVREGYDYTESRQERLKTEFSLSQWERFDYHQKGATLVFSSGGVPRLTMSIQIVGSVSTVSGTWLWSWDNASILDEAAECVHLLRKFGSQHGFDRLSTAKWEAEEVDGWEMVSIACLLLGGEGVYRAPGENGPLFMVVREPHWLDS